MRFLFVTLLQVLFVTLNLNEMEKHQLRVNKEGGGYLICDRICVAPIYIWIWI